MGNKLKSGESYNLQTIFSGINDKIVIPDLQRDYCWGNSDLVNKFLDTIISLDKSEKWPMGLIYGYSDTLSPEHIQLCDGQQRLTTLFLIVGVINRLLPDNKYKHLLISDFELENDDQEPYLQYAIRESSLYFLSDLVCHYFLNKDEIKSVEHIPEQPWYLRIYTQDPTVKNILRAVKLIEERFLQLDKLEELGDFITTNMEFMFYDMENRTNGEETFVVINTSGEPLSANQNLKPKIINEYKNQYPCIAEDWERMETWFWQHRNRDEKNPHTSDEGMSEFLRCLMILKEYETNKEVNFSQESERFPYKNIDYSTMLRYFNAYKLIYTTDFSERHDKMLKYPYSQEFLFVILPTLQYCYKYIDSIDKDDVKRVYHLFCNLSRYIDLSKPEGPVAKALAIVNIMKDKDILCLKEYPTLRDEEKKKLNLIANAGENRKETELLFAEAENNPIFNGQISILLQWSENNIDALQHYLNRVNELWNGECNDNIDILRRALLTRNLQDYPLDLPNKSHLTLGLEYKEWFNIIRNNVVEVKSFLDDQQSLQEMIDNYSDKSSPYYAIIKDADILSKSCRKNIRKGRNNIVIVMEKERSSSDYLIIFNGIYYPKNLITNGWNYLWEYEGLLYTDHSKYNLTIEYMYDIHNDGYKILIWSGKYEQKKSYNNLCDVQKLGLHHLDGKGDDCWETDYIENGNDAKLKLIEIANWIN